jgi:hypothetical protein
LVNFFVVLWFFLLFVFILCLVCPMLLMSLGCPFLFAQCCWCLWVVHSCLPNVADVSGLSVLVCSMLLMSLGCPFLFAQCCWCLWVVHSWLPLRFFLTLTYYCWEFVKEEKYPVLSTNICSVYWLSVSVDHWALIFVQYTDWVFLLII